MNEYLSKYDNFVIIGDINIDVEDKTNPNFDKFAEFCDTFSMLNLLKDYICFIKTHKSSIDLILTNKEHLFRLTKTNQTLIDVVHPLKSAFMEAQTTPLSPKKIVYKDFKNFKEENKLKDFSRKSDDSNENYEFLSYQFQSLVNKHAPLKTKISRGNNGPFVNKSLRKKIYKRSALRNKLLKDSSDLN